MISWRNSWRCGRGVTGPRDKRALRFISILSQDRSILATKGLCEQPETSVHWRCWPDDHLIVLPWTNNGLIPDGSTAVTQVNWRHQQNYGKYRLKVNLATHGEDNLGLFKSFRYSRIFKLSFDEYKSHIKLTRYVQLKISFNATTSFASTQAKVVKVFTHFKPPFRVMAYLKQNINVLAENFSIIKNKRKLIIYIILCLTRTPILNWLFIT